MRPVATRLDRLDRNGTLRAAFDGPVAAAVAGVLNDRGAPGGDHCDIEVRELRHEPPVYRVHAAAAGWTRSVIVKRHDPDAARRTRLVIRRWLPWVDLRHLSPALLGAAASSDVEWVWHIYEDVGDATLHDQRSDRARVAAAVDSIAELHTRAAGHPVVAECRRDGLDLGVSFFTNSVTDGLSLLDALEPPAVSLSPEQAEVRDRLRRRLERLLDDAPRRVRTMEEAGGPATLLHGDLWTTNIVPDEDGPGVRLIDWDRVGVGSFGYDLSILLYRFPAGDREWILDRYRSAVARAGWRLASAASDLNLLFDTAECARYAYRISWPAIALLRDGAEWGFGELAEIDGWFRALEPVLPG